MSKTHLYPSPRPAFAVSLLALTVTSANAQAQDAPRGYEEIVVTARNRVEVAQDIPLPIQVLGNAELEREDITTLWDLPFRFRTCS